jgi:hypothetical protein
MVSVDNAPLDQADSDISPILARDLLGQDGRHHLKILVRLLSAHSRYDQFAVLGKVAQQSLKESSAQLRAGTLWPSRWIAGFAGLEQMRAGLFPACFISH